MLSRSRSIISLPKSSSERSTRRFSDMSILDRFQIIRKLMQHISETTRKIRYVVPSSVYGERPYEKSSRLSRHYAGHYLHELREQVRSYKVYQEETMSRWSSRSSSGLFWSYTIGTGPYKGISSRSSSGLFWSYTIGTGPYKGIIENQEMMKVCLSETHASGKREAFTYNDWWKANWWNKY